MPTITATQEVDVDLDVEIWCARCGAGLCNTVTIKGTSINVPPCDSCMGEIKKDGYDEGYDVGYEIGKEETLS